jgi:hypothetical protein
MNPMEKSENFLDFVYVGAPRCGSTWLAAALEEHPGIWIPHNKEIHFFNDRLVYPFEYKYPRGIEHYRTYFNDAPNNVRIGELSPFYYFDPQAAYRIHQHFPQTKIVIFLRDPAEMLNSLYLLLRRRERREATLEAELAKNPQLLDLGFYHRLITPYFDWFPKDNIFIAVYENFFADEAANMQRLFRFLNVDTGFLPSVMGKRVNWSQGDNISRVEQLRGQVIRLLNTKPLIPLKEILHRLKINRMDYSASSANEGKKVDKPKIRPQTRRELIELYQPDIERLEDTLSRDLSRWKTP